MSSQELQNLSESFLLTRQPASRANAILCFCLAIALIVSAVLMPIDSHAQDLDDIDWTLVGTADWQPRDSQAEYVHAGRLWIAGGHAQPLSSEVWSLALPKDWQP